MPRLLAILFLLVASTSRAQNLVPNPGFEDYTLCPYERSNVAWSPDYTHFPSVTSWVSALWNTTPDYYNTCATNPLVSMPLNTYNDFQHPRNGEGCIGFSMMSGYPYDLQRSDYREYAETKLTAPLEAGQQYYVSYFVNMTYHIPWDYVQIVVDQIGARLTDTLLHYQYPFGEPQLIIPGPPSIANKMYTYLSDTAAWMKVSGLYTAHGGEQWLTLGYFRDSLPIHHIVLYTPVADTYSKHVACYMYVDDVCVSKVSPPSHDTLYAGSFPYTITAPAASEHQWSTGAAGQGITIGTPGTYWVIISDDCYYKVDTFTVLCTEQTIHTDTVIYVSSFPLSITTPQAGDSTRWGNGSTERTLSINAPGSYEVTTWSSCKRYIHTIEVQQRSMDECIWLPSAFTPNADGKNDAFGPVFSCATLPPFYNFSIYNRFGERVFNTDDPTEKWNGTYKGHLADIGAYYYMLRYSGKAKSGKIKANDPDVVLLKGDVTLLR
jgi:gliding motility-associated-like protein